MALLSDGPTVTIEDLSEYDSSVLEVAHTESIDLTRKLALAHEEIEVELETLLPRSVGDDSGLGHQPSLANVVVTPPLRLWHVFRTLTLVYRDAYGSQLNDRYQARRDEYEALAQWAERKLEQTGIGIAWDPVPQAAAPQLTAVNGSLGPATVFASVSYVSESGAEGAAGPAVSLEVALEHTLSVRAVSPPANARYWNVFAGASAEQLVQQNVAPLALDGAWTANGALATTGRAPGSGQEPDCLRALLNLLRRG